MSTPAELNVDQLRDRIDRSGAGDKVAYPDPAAAPLGTDAEAGGAPPKPEELRMESVAARRRKPDHSWVHSRPGTPVYLVLVGIVSAAILAIVGLTPGA